MNSPSAIEGGKSPAPWVKLSFDRLRASQFGRHVVVLTGGTVVGRAITAAAIPLLSRLYTPADFGVLAVFFSLATTLITVSCLNYEAAIPLPKDDQSGFSVMSVSCIVLLFTTGLCSVGVILYGQRIVRLVHTPQLGPYMWLLPINVFGGGFFAILNWWAIRVQAFRSLAKRRVAQSACQVITQLSVPVFTRGPFGLLLGDSAGDAGGITLLAADTVRYLKSHALHFPAHNLVEVARRYKKFPTFGLASVFVHTGFSVLPAFLLTRLYGLEETGWYGLVNQMLVVAAGLIGLAIAQVYLSNAAQLAHSAPLKLRSLFFRTSRIAFLLSLLPAAILILLGPPLFAFVFGARWAEAGKYAQLLAIPFLVMLTVGPVYPTLTVLERLDWQFIADLIGLVVMIAGMSYVHKLGLSGRWAVGAYGLSVLVTYGLLFGFAWLAIQLRCRQARTS